MKDFQALFNESRFTKVEIGKLYVPTGKILCGDPFIVTSELEPNFPTGEFPVEILLLKTKDWGVRVAYARVLLDESQVDEYLPVNNRDSESYFGVDAGLGCFMDKQTHEIFQKKMEVIWKKDGNYYTDVLEAEFSLNSGLHGTRDGGDWVDHRPDKEQKNNIIMFASGYGDGAYYHYIFKDQEGSITAIYIDFEVEDLEEDNDNTEIN